ncbi:MAG: stilbene synthase [Candidatus Kapabacteria bacterium]|nr:stilbene synthase [Candidatus Kapabacteria bacterium]
MSVRIAGIGTALPPYVVDQPTVRSIVEAVFPDLPPTLQRVLSTFSHDHIQTRHFVRPPSWYAERHGFGHTNDTFIAEATTLATQAAQAALLDAGMTAESLSAVVVVSTTGLATPSLDAAVALNLGCLPSIKRMPIVGLGCAGGVTGLARAAEICSVLAAPVLFVAVEVCSVTMQRSDHSKSNLVGTSLFGDGAGAVVMHADGRYPRIAASWSHLFPGTEDIMGWEVVDTGLKVRFSRDIPAFISSNVGPVLQQALSAWSIADTDIDRLIPHPGGAKVLDAYAGLLGHSDDELAIARDVLRSCGNMSSATVLFVLELTLRSWRADDRLALMTALGPGFSAEFVLLEDA